MEQGRTLFERSYAEHAEVLHRTRETCGPALEAMLEAWTRAVRAGGKLLFFGNGGSAGDAQHLATELTVRFKKSRAPIAALALTTDSSTLTAIGNDMGFAELFARQIAAIGRPGDVAIGITTSGRSANVTRALEAAKAQGLVTAAFAGCGGGELVDLADPMIVVPSDTTARIQEMHILLGQMLCEALERELGLV